MEYEYGDDFSNLFNEINFDFLPSQSNIYGVSSFKEVTQGSNKVLIGLLDGRIFVSEYSKSSHDEVAKLESRKVIFTYIPSSVDIISFDSFSSEERGLIIGITLCNKESKNYFNIYCNCDDDIRAGLEWNVDHVGQNWQNFDLTFTPYQLTHSKIKNPFDQSCITVFILLGSDGCFYVYAPSKNKGKFSPTNEPASKYFIELNNSPKIPTYLEIQNFKESKKSKRLSAIGYSFGKVEVFLVDVEINTLISSWSIDHDSPIGQCQLFMTMNSLHLVVISARELAVMYCDVLKNGLTYPVFFEGSDKYDCATCCAVADTNYNGKKEILVGTYGRRVLAYSFDSCQNSQLFSPVWIREFSAPILKIKFTDIIGDGIDEMIVVTNNGIHIFQSNLKNLLNKCKIYLHLI